MHENSHCFTGTSSQIFDVVSLINFSYSSGNIWLCIMIAHLFVFITTSNFSNSSGQTPRCHPWFLSFFHTSLLLYPQFLLILPSERCHYSSTSYHPTATLVQTVITAYHYQPSSLSPASALVPCSLFLTRRHTSDHASLSSRVPFSLRMKAHVFSLICRAYMIWVYGYFLYMFSRGLISNTTLSWLHSS